MKKTIVIIFAIIIGVIAIWGYLRFVVGGDEDTWICENGQWVKHGVPSSPMPTEPCGEADKINSNNVIPSVDLSGQFNWSTMNEGPYRDSVTYATSLDLLN